MSPSANTGQLAPRLTGFLLTLLGGVFLAISFVSSLMTQQFIAQARRAQATVVSLYAGTSHPTLEFVDSRGERFEFHATGWTSHRVGDRVSVLFLDGDPETSARLEEPGSLWFLPAAFGLLGGSAFLTGVFVVVRQRQKLET